MTRGNVGIHKGRIVLQIKHFTLGIYLLSEQEGDATGTLKKMQKVKWVQFSFKSMVFMLLSSPDPKNIQLVGGILKI